MTVLLELLPEQERRLNEEAAARGQDAGDVLRDLLERALEQIARPAPSGQPRRIAGLNRGQMQMADDFDAPLPESFRTASSL